MRSILFCSIFNFMISMAARCSEVCGCGHDSLPAGVESRREGEREGEREMEGREGGGRGEEGEGRRGREGGRERGR